MGADRYFVRIAPPPAGGTPDLTNRAGLGTDRPRRRRRKKLHLGRPLGTVLLVGVVAWFAWAQFDQSSTANHQLKTVIGDAKQMVVNASTDPTLKRAEIFYNQQFSATGSYPNLNDQQLHNGQNTDFGVGVTVQWCAPNVVVLQSMTGTGAISRLLESGKTIGDALGTHNCPADYANPTPWTVKPAA